MASYNTGSVTYVSDSNVGSMLAQPVQIEGTRPTYSTAVSPTLAATATDVVTISPAASSPIPIRIKRIAVVISAGAAGVLDAILKYHNALDTAGTSSSPNIQPHDPNDPVSTAVVKAFTANPTINATGSGLVVVRWAKMGITAASGEASVVWDFVTRGSKSLMLRKSTDELAINLNGATLLLTEAATFELEWDEGA